jgi:hypothetical protein
MTGEQRLIEVVSALDEVQMPYLIMGGHAVRYYGFRRDTTDFDLHISAESSAHLTDLLAKTSLFVAGLPAETVTWCGEDFRRFVVGTLPDGKDELLEFWVRNHLLDDFDALYQRREVGMYAGRQMSFLSLPDLIRSKETERDDDWQDIKILEELLDQRNLATVKQGGDAVTALANIRSVRGLELAIKQGLTNQQENVDAALSVTRNPITQAFLLPFAPTMQSAVPETPILPGPFRNRLLSIAPGSSLHLSIVEAIRLRYKRVMQDIDRQDKDERFRQPLRSH